MKNMIFPMNTTTRFFKALVFIVHTHLTSLKLLHIISTITWWRHQMENIFFWVSFMLRNVDVLFDFSINLQIYCVINTFSINQFCFIIQLLFIRQESETYSIITGQNCSKVLNIWWWRYTGILECLLRLFSVVAYAINCATEITGCVYSWLTHLAFIITSSHGNTFRITDHLRAIHWSQVIFLIEGQ